MFLFKRKSFTRILIALILIVFLAVPLTACKGKSGEKSASIGKTTPKASSQTTKKTGTASLTSAKTGTNASSDVGSNNGDIEGNEAAVDNGENPVDGNTGSAPETTVDFGGKTITISLWQDVYMPKLGVSEVGDIGYRIFENAKQKYNCQVNWKLVTGTSATYAAQISSSMLAGLKFADIAMVMTNDTYPVFIQQKFMRPLDNYIDNSKGWWMDIRWNGTSYLLWPAVTAKSFGYVTTYNTSILENNGLGDILDIAVNNGWNWDALINYGVACTRDFNGDGIIDQWGLSGGSLFYQSILFSNGVMSVMQKDGTMVSGAHESNGVRALSLIYDLKNTYKVVDSAANSLPGFNQGKVGLYFCPAAYGRSIFPNLNTYKMAPLPLGPDVSEYPIIRNGAGGWAVLANTDYDTGDLITFMADAINTWDPEKPEYADPYDLFYTGWLDVVHDTDNITTMWDLAQKTSTVQNDAGIGIPGLTALINQQIYAPVLAGQKAVGTALEETRPAVEKLIADALKE